MCNKYMQKLPRCKNGTRRVGADCVPHVKPVAAVSKSPIVVTVAAQRARVKATTTKRKRKPSGKLDKKLVGKLRGLLVNVTARQKSLLSVVCKNPNNCLALGRYDDVVKSYFAGFANFDYVTEVTKLSEGYNGVVMKVNYENAGVHACTVLKINGRNEADNLYYEWYVGKHFINHLTKLFPCFVETYGLYKLNAGVTAKTITKKDLNEMTNVENISIGDTCKFNKQLALVCQYYEDSVTFTTYIRKVDDVYPNIYNLLYQVFFALSLIKNYYTHYDLHTNNVILYKPFSYKRYITMNYHAPSGKIVYSFKSEYICKIIDYGRNYFDTLLFKNGTRKFKNSSEILQAVVNEPKLCPNNGINKGYESLSGALHPHFKPTRRNMGADLFLMKDLYYEMGNNLPIKYPFLDNIRFSPEDCKPHKTPILTCVSDYCSNKAFMNKVRQINAQLTETYYATWTEAAVMNIYSDGKPYTFELTGAGAA